jgi:uncharacterized protein
MDLWHQLGVAIALLFVIEGIVPFLSPGRWRNLVQVMAHMNDRTMRTMGLLSMLLGVVLLYLVN